MKGIEEMAEIVRARIRNGDDRVVSCCSITVKVLIVPFNELQSSLFFMVWRNLFDASCEAGEVGRHSNRIIRTLVAERSMNCIVGIIEGMVEDERIRPVHEHDVVHGHFFFSLSLDRDIFLSLFMMMIKK